MSALKYLGCVRQVQDNSKRKRKRSEPKYAKKGFPDYNFLLVIFLRKIEHSTSCLETLYLLPRRIIIDVVVQDEASNGNIDTLSISIVTQTNGIQTIYSSAW